MLRTNRTGGTEAPLRTCRFGRALRGAHGPAGARLPHLRSATCSGPRRTGASGRSLQASDRPSPRALVRRCCRGAGPWRRRIPLPRRSAPPCPGSCRPPERSGWPDVLSPRARPRTAYGRKVSPRSTRPVAAARYPVGAAPASACRPGSARTGAAVAHRPNRRHVRAVGPHRIHHPEGLRQAPIIAVRRGTGVLPSLVVARTDRERHPTSPTDT